MRKKEEKGEAKEEEEEDRQRRRRPTQRQRRWTTGITITAIISFLPCISHLPLPFSYSTEAGASSSTSDNLSSIKQSSMNNIKGLLDFNTEHNNSDLFDNKKQQQERQQQQQQQDIIVSMPPMMMPTSAGSAGSAVTSVLPQHRPFAGQRGRHRPQAQPTDHRPQDPRQHHQQTTMTSSTASSSWLTAHQSTST